MEPHPPVLEIQQLSLSFGKVKALDSVDLSIETGEIICLLGQSGCGKSTLLRTIAGVETPDGGAIAIDGQQVFALGVMVEPEHRKVGFMLQDYALFPHLTSRQNIAFGLNRLNKSEAKERVDTLAERLGITHLLERYPHMLSGGEQQRIALARALAPRPRLLLMDEPFSNLDRGLRDTLRAEVIGLLRGLKTTAIIVTHDPEEALSIGDRIVLMHKGKVIEQGSGTALFNAPKTAFTAGFFSRMNRIPARQNGDFLETALGRFPAPQSAKGITEIYVRPRALHFGETGISAQVLSHAALGEIEEWTVTVPGLTEPLLIRTSQRYNFSPGAQIKVSASNEEVFAFATE